MWTIVFLLVSTFASLCSCVNFCKGTQGPRDCSDLLPLKQKGILSSGVYRIWPDAWPFVGTFQVYCDMTTDGGGWTVFQRRGNFSTPPGYFFKNWKEYKLGFGSLEEEFWLGNERLFYLTNQDAYELRIDMWDGDNKQVKVNYQTFWVDNEERRFQIHLSNFTGDPAVGNSFGIVDGSNFSTKDRDNDFYKGSCAGLYKGGWWYTACHAANLNGLNLRGKHDSYADGINWKTWKGYHYSLSRVEMKIRPLISSYLVGKNK